MMLGSIIFSEQAKGCLHQALKGTKVLDRCFLHDLKISEILQVETTYHSPVYVQTWVLCRLEPHYTYYCVLTRDDEGTYWRLVWLGTVNSHVPRLRHVYAECVNEVYLDVGALTFYI